jgi:hypothetical protein
MNVTLQNPEDAFRLLVDLGAPQRLVRHHELVVEAASILLEDLLVALADKLWKGKREQELEARVMEMLAKSARREPWDVFEQLDSICEQIAADGSSRLARSVI